MRATVLLALLALPAGAIAQTPTFGEAAQSLVRVFSASLIEGKVAASCDTQKMIDNVMNETATPVCAATVNTLLKELEANDGPAEPIARLKAYKLLHNIP